MPGARPWEMPEVCGVNRLPMHSLPPPFPSAEEAACHAASGPVGRDDAGNPWMMGLGGEWDFILFPSPEEVPGDFLDGGRGTPAADTSNGSSAFPVWGRILVPGSWTVQGRDKPHYTNVVMPFDCTPPAVPRDNPTGVYRRSFDLPDGWGDRRVVLRVGSAESYLEVRVNGLFAGSSKDTRLPAEFDITGLLRKGFNLLVLTVVRYSDSSYVEDQDQWWFGGLHRAVFLYCTPNVYIADADLRPVPSPGFRTGVVEARVSVGFGPGSKGLERTAVRFTLIGPDGASIGSAEAEVNPDYRTGRREVSLSLSVDSPLPWSHESPALYTAVLSLLDASPKPAGRMGRPELDNRAVMVGFRTVEVRGRSLLINGKRVLIKGVNRHEHDQCMAKTLSAETMLEDILLLKRNNFNAVRTSHYPNDERWYELCDRFGIYLVDEANIEHHAYYDHLCRDPAWAPAYLARMSRMVLRDRNHPSVILWSLGNESGYGQNHDMIAAWTRRADLTRPLHYEGAGRPEWGQGPHTVESLCRGLGVTDIVCPMYPPIELLEAWDAEVDAGDDPRPLIMCEYSHAMGNSNGSLADYWRAIESSRALQGGFIWDWIDQGILVDEEGRPVGPRGPSAGASGPSIPAGTLGRPSGRRNPLVSPSWRYGGDFGDSPTDRDFCLNGLLFPDRTAKPAMADCKKAFQPIRIRSAHPASGVFTVENRQDFSDTSSFALSWRIAFDPGIGANGLPCPECPDFARGTAAIPLLAPGERADVTIPELSGPEALALISSRECLIRFDITLAQDLAWAGKGHPVAWEEFPLSSAPVTAAIATVTGGEGALQPRAPTAVTGGDGSIAIEGDGYRAVISADGFLSSFADSATGTEFLSSPLRPNLFRAPTENDGLKNFEDARGNPDFAFYYEGKAVYPWLDAGLSSLSFERVADRGPGCGPFVGSKTGFRILHRIRGAGAGGAESVELGTMSQEWTFTGAFARCACIFALGNAVPEYPRVGLSCLVPARIDGVSWFGRGPGESYPDRKEGSPTGFYRASVDSLYVPYTVPQENGNRSDVRSIELYPTEGRQPGAEDGAGSVGPRAGRRDSRGVLRIEAAVPISFSLSRFDPEAMWRETHADRLKPIDGAILFLDAAMRGVGTATCGPDTREEYRVRPGIFRMDLTFSIPV